MDGRWGGVLQALVFCAIGLAVSVLTKKRPTQTANSLTDILRRKLRIMGILLAIGSAGAAIHLLLIIWGYMEH